MSELSKKPSSRFEIPNDDKLIEPLKILYDIAITHSNEWKIATRQDIDGLSCLVSPYFKSSNSLADLRLVVYPDYGGLAQINIEQKTDKNHRRKLRLPLFSIVIAVADDDNTLDIQRGMEYPDNPDFDIVNPDPNRFVKSDDVQRVDILAIIETAIKEFSSSDINQ